MYANIFTRTIPKGSNRGKHTHTNAPTHTHNKNMYAHTYAYHNINTAYIPTAAPPTHFPPNRNLITKTHKHQITNIITPNTNSQQNPPHRVPHAATPRNPPLPHPHTHTHTPRDIADGVPPSPQHQHWHAEALDVLDSLGVPLERKVEAAQAIARQRIGSALQHHRRGLVQLHHL